MNNAAIKKERGGKETPAEAKENRPSQPPRGSTRSFLVALRAGKTKNTSKRLLPRQNEVECRHLYYKLTVNKKVI